MTYYGNSSVSPDGWTGGYELYNPGPESFLSAEDGNQFEDLGGEFQTSYELSQTVDIASAGQYLLTWYEAFGGPSELSLSLDYTGSSTGLPLTQPFSGGSEEGNPSWSQASESLDLTSTGELTVTFYTSGETDNDAFLDNVVLEPVSHGGVPDAAGTLALLSLALGGMALLASRRRRPITAVILTDQA